MYNGLEQTQIKNNYSISNKKKNRIIKTKFSC